MKDLKTLYSEKLESLSNNITAQEKIEALEELSISRPTLDKYLKGEVVKIETATQLIKFFSGKVNDRIKELRKMNVA